MDLIYTIVAIVASYYIFYKFIKPNFLIEEGKSIPKIKRKQKSDDGEYVDYEEVDD